MTSKKYDEGFVEGYRVGMNTAFDFVIRYCEDYKDEMSQAYRVIDKKNTKVIAEKVKR